MIITALPHQISGSRVMKQITFQMETKKLLAVEAISGMNLIIQIPRGW